MVGGVGGRSLARSDFSFQKAALLLYGELKIGGQRWNKKSHMTQTGPRQRRPGGPAGRTGRPGRCGRARGAGGGGGSDP